MISGPRMLFTLCLYLSDLCDCRTPELKASLCVTSHSGTIIHNQQQREALPRVSPYFI